MLRPGRLLHESRNPRVAPSCTLPWEKLCVSLHISFGVVWALYRTPLGVKPPFPFPAFYVPLTGRHGSLFTPVVSLRVRTRDIAQSNTAGRTGPSWRRRRRRSCRTTGLTPCLSARCAACRLRRCQKIISTKGPASSKSDPIRHCLGLAPCFGGPGLLLRRGPVYDRARAWHV